jgi:hypothetical protein
MPPADPFDFAYLAAGGFYPAAQIFFDVSFDHGRKSLSPV